MVQLQVVAGDITRLAVDAIVNAANSALAGGGGVDGAIHAGAGPELLKASLALGGCATGDAKATPGFRLPAKWVFHAVGPVWRGGAHGEDAALASCYRRCIELATVHEVRTIAFPRSLRESTAFPRSEPQKSPSAPSRNGPTNVASPECCSAASAGRLPPSTNGCWQASAGFRAPQPR